MWVLGCTTRHFVLRSTLQQSPAFHFQHFSPIPHPFFAHRPLCKHRSSFSTAVTPTSHISALVNHAITVIFVHVPLFLCHSPHQHFRLHCRRLAFSLLPRIIDYGTVVYISYIYKSHRSSHYLFPPSSFAILCLLFFDHPFLPHRGVCRWTNTNAFTSSSLSISRFSFRLRFMRLFVFFFFFVLLITCLCKNSDDRASCHSSCSHQPNV